MANLHIKDIYKNFGKTEVLKGISFTLNEGEKEFKVVME